MLLAIACGGASGTVMRFLIGQWLPRTTGGFPLATWGINVGGSFAIALFARILSTPTSSPLLRAALTVGLCGGFTTYSTFSAEIVALVQEGRAVRAAAYVAVSLACGVLAVVAGLSLGGRLMASRG
jgi:CrcB protein